MYLDIGPDGNRSTTRSNLLSIRCTSLTICVKRFPSTPGLGVRFAVVTGSALFLSEQFRWFAFNQNKGSTYRHWAITF